MLYSKNKKRSKATTIFRLKNYIESNNRNRMILYNKVKLSLSLGIIKIKEETKKMLRDYFEVYEDKGEEGHLRVDHVVRSVWRSSFTLGNL